MEIHSATTRFTLICNYVSRIIDPIASRCSKFRFKTLAGEHAGGRLQEIAEKDSLHYETGVTEKLLAVSEGDMRRAVTYLQSSYNLTSAAATASTKVKRAKKIVESDDSEVEMADAPPLKSAPVIVTIRTVEEVAGVIPAAVIQDLVSAMQPSKRGPIYEVVSNQVRNMVADGWSANQILSQLYTVLVADETLDPRKKLQIFAIFSEVDKRLVDGSEESLAILDLSLRLAAVLRDRK